MKRIDPGQRVRPEHQKIVCVDGRSKRARHAGLVVVGAGRVTVDLDVDFVGDHTLWVHIDGKQVLRVTQISGLTVDDHRLRWGGSSGGTYQCSGVPRGDAPALRGGAHHAACRKTLAQHEAELAALTDVCPEDLVSSVTASSPAKCLGASACG